MLLWQPAQAVFAEPPPPPEYQVKAVFLYNFAKFVDWPRVSHEAESSIPFSICILGRDPFGDHLNLIRDQSAKGREITTRIIVDLDGAANCDCLFISGSEKERLAAILKTLRGKNILTVGDMEGFVEAGGVIQFVMEGKKIRFVVNLAAAERAGLKISSKLLELAREIKKE